MFVFYFHSLLYLHILFTFFTLLIFRCINYFSIFYFVCGSLVAPVPAERRKLSCDAFQIPHHIRDVNYASRPSCRNRNYRDRNLNPIKGARLLDCYHDFAICMKQVSDSDHSV